VVCHKNIQICGICETMAIDRWLFSTVFFSFLRFVVLIIEKTNSTLPTD
jgi:hypothetical protein